MSEVDLRSSRNDDRYDRRYARASQTLGAATGSILERTLMQVRVLDKVVEVRGDDGMVRPLQQKVAEAVSLLVVVGEDPVRRRRELARRRRPSDSTPDWRWIPRERLKAMLWGGDDIDQDNSLKALMSKVKRVMGSRLKRANNCYGLFFDEWTDYVDLQVLPALVDAANKARCDDPETAVLLYEHVLRHWSDSALTCMPTTAEAAGHVGVLREERQAIVEAMLETQLDLGRHRDVVARTPMMIAADPLNEHLRGLRMRALARSGRKAEALREYDQAEVVVRTETGTEPGPNLQRLRDQIHANDPAVLEWHAPPVRASDERVRRAFADSSDHAVLARMLNYMWGGDVNLPPDRAKVAIVHAAAAEQEALPLETAEFCRRAVRVAAKAGLDQFIEIGTGLTTRDPIHQVARRVVPAARVLYVSDDPAVAAYLQAHGIGGEDVDIIHAAIWEPKAIIEAAAATLDLSRPVGILIREVLNYVDSEDDPWGAIETLVAAVPSQSRLMLSVATSEGLMEVVQQQIHAQRVTTPQGKPLRFWSPEAIMDMFVGLPLSEPGLVDANQWRPERTGRAPIGPMRGLVAMAIKP
ncbi:hypothetical protein GCM10010411_75940 [Actinomadura fulvescens]|uniref:Bacterial transcriptional activator domain-containing protein n=1 Tax=Actinomadura fulvescens TaxID=46160 RepID=A0ABP6CYI2_9ACTN